MKRNKKEDILLNTDNDDISMLAEIQTDPDEVTAMEFNKEIPVMPLRNMVMFPSVVMPVTIGRPSTLKLVNAAYKKKLPIAVVCQIQGDMDDPGFNDVYHVGVIGKILRVFEMPGGNTTVIMQSNGPKVHLDSITKTSPYLKGIVTPIPEANDQLETDEFKALIDTCKDLTSKFIEASEKMSPDTVFAIKNLDNPEILVNFICANFPIPVEEKIKLLKAGDLQSRLYMLVKILNREVQLADIKQSIQMRTREDIDRQQREYFLQQQIKNIQDELGAGQEDEIDELRQKGKTKKWSPEMAELFEKEVSKLERTNSQSPDFNVQLTYLQTLLGLPWNVFTTDNLNISNAEKTLNKDHYGLEKVKERILEHLAVLKLKGDMKSPIICLYGPPGVGKTSLGRSIAASLKRKYVRMSLGGVHDEAEIRGHRKTYIGAMPGRIIKSLIKAESSNPVIILDEIDKLGSDHRGDPSSAMLEVLDPEQNNTFHDNYLDVDYDLSKVMFIATANNLSTIPPALLDRMELIEVSGYITEEKVEIARRHLVPKELEAVIAHELSHIRNKDVRLMIVSIVFVGIFAMLAQMAMRSVYYSSMGHRRDEKNNTAIIIFLVMVVAAIGYFFSMLMRFAISRKREYLADAGAAEMTKNPLALASALRKISADPDIEAVKREDVAQLFIQHPGQQAKSALNGLSGLFATHPPIEKRIQVLEQF